MRVEDVLEVADEDESGGFVVEPGEGVEQAQEVLVGAEAADVKEEAVGGVDAVLAEDALGWCRWRAGVEGGDGALDDDADLVGREAEVADEVAFGGFGDGDDVRWERLTAACSLSDQERRPRRVGKTRSGWVKGRVSCMVTTTRGTIQTGT